MDTMRLAPGERVLLQNPSALVSVYLGGPTVTTSDYGHELKPGTTLPMDLDRSDQLFGIAAVAQTINVLRMRGAN